MKTISWKNHVLQTVLLALPICLSNVGHITVDLADNYFIGQLDNRTVGQAAMSLAGAFYIFILVLAIGLSYGLTPIVAELNAKGEKEKIRVHLRHSLAINLIVAAFLFTVLFFCAPLLRMAGRPAHVTELSIEVLNVIMLSMIPLSIFFTFKQFTEGMSDTKTAMYITIGANGMNILMCYLLCFGKFGFPQMGVLGACWATFFSRCAMALTMFLYVRYGKKYADYKFSFFTGKYDWETFKAQLKIGLPSGLMFSMEVAAFAIPTLFIPGTSQLAAHRLAMSLAAMTYMVSSGLGAAATIRVGHFVGMVDRVGMRRAGFSAILLALGFMSLAALFFILFREQLPSVFNKEADVLKYASSLLLIAAAFQLFDGTQVTAQGALRGLKDTIYPGWIAFLAYWVVGLPTSWFLCIKMELGAAGVWYGFIAGLAVASFGFI
ncbi:MAG TPA: MATE family efflux transporter, partial [Bacteroidia bacterium]|nr:MATE family efflux transporter [Bacteroidia bacterium]